MKINKSHSSFLENLKQKMKLLRKMKSEDVHVFTINAHYGRYQIIIAPSTGNCDQTVEITGNIHHLFLSPKKISPNPSRYQVQGNLKDTVIARDLKVHLVDPNGDGKILIMKKSDAHPKEFINLAGRKGKNLINKVESSGELSIAAYKIIQKDVLRSLKEKKERLS